MRDERRFLSFSLSLTRTVVALPVPGTGGVLVKVGEVCASLLCVVVEALDVGSEALSLVGELVEGCGVGVEERVAHAGKDLDASGELDGAAGSVACVGVELVE